MREIIPVPKFSYTSSWRGA